MARPDLPLDRLAALRPTPRGIGFLAVALVGLVAAYPSGWPALSVVSLFLLGAVAAGIVSVVLAPSVLDVERRVDPDVAEQGEVVRVRLSVRGTSPGALEWVEELPRSVDVTGHAEGRLPSVRPDRPATLLEYTITGRHRGALPVGPLRVARTDALGLVVTRRRVGPVDRIVVLPRIRPVELPHAVRRVDPDARASTEFGAVGDQRDIIARGYRAGDPMRSVDWRATARRGELMVRTEVAASSAAAGLVLDTRSSAWSEAALFEWAVEYAASITSALDERRATVRLAAAAGRVAHGATPVLVELATVERGGRGVGPDGLAGLIHSVSDSGVQIVHVVTGDTDHAALRRLPALRGETTGIVSVVSRGGSAPEAAHGWHVHLLQPDPARGRGRG